jgi:hypothetical protein
MSRWVRKPIPDAADAFRLAGAHIPHDAYEGHDCDKQKQGQTDEIFEESSGLSHYLSFLQWFRLFLRHLSLKLSDTPEQYILWRVLTQVTVQQLKRYRLYIP